MKLAIVGSRTFNDYGIFERIILENYKLENIKQIISGDCYGIDKLAEIFADKYSIEILIFKPEWNNYGKSAGFIRNKLIVENCDTIIAFWDGISRGTKLTIDIANKSYRYLKIINLEQLSK